MVTKISNWSRIQDSVWITPKIESLVVFAIPDMPSKFQKDPSITFWVILLTHRQTDKNWQTHNLLGRGNYVDNRPHYQFKDVLTTFCQLMVVKWCKTAICHPNEVTKMLLSLMAKNSKQSTALYISPSLLECSCLPEVGGMWYSATQSHISKSKK